MTRDPSETPTPIPREGSLAQHHPEDVLRFCDAVHFTGTLSFESPSGKGILPVLNGFPEVDEHDGVVQAALDEFVALREGTFKLQQILPQLANATREGDLAITGTLAAGQIPDLMRYCESAGITGTLHLYREDHQCDARYVAGDLDSITVDREEDAQLEHVFGWTEGKFRIEAKPLFVDDDRVSAPEPQLLKTLEVALAEIMDQRARRETNTPLPSVFRAPSIRDLEGVSFGVERAEGATAPAPSTPRVASIAPPRRSLQPPSPGTDSTVKVFFVARPSSGTEKSATRHAAAHLGREEVVLDPASQKLAPLSEAAAAATIERASRPERATPDAGSRKPAAPEPFRVNAWNASFGAIALAAGATALVLLYMLVR